MIEKWISYLFWILEFIRQFLKALPVDFCPSFWKHIFFDFFEVEIIWAAFSGNRSNFLEIWARKNLVFHSLRILVFHSLRISKTVFESFPWGFLMIIPKQSPWIPFFLIHNLLLSLFADYPFCSIIPLHFSCYNNAVQVW